MSIKTFLKDESGAITVDWVVMTAGLVGLGLATTAVVSGGTEAASGDINGALSSQLISGFFSATAALTSTSVWNDPGVNSREFSNVDELSFSSTVQFALGDEGIIFEGGGTGRGFILYQTNGMLYLQAGDGGATGPSASRGETSWAVSEGTHTIEGSMNANGGMALYVNGNLVDQSSFQAASLAGGDVGTVAGGANSVSVNRGGFNANSDGHPGVGEVTFYEDQTTGDELVPIS